MPRVPRPLVDNGVYHVTTRGNGRQIVFLTEHDGWTFLAMLDRVWRRYGWDILCYCLMDNHYHLVVRTPKANLDGGMRDLNSLYARKFNQRHGLSGHLFQRRYHEELVVRDEHLLELVRYIALNPVRAGLCPKPEDWILSSYRAAVGLASPAGFLATDWIRDLFASVAELERFVSDGVKPLPTPTPWR